MKHKMLLLALMAAVGLGLAATPAGAHTGGDHAKRDAYLCVLVDGDNDGDLEWLLALTEYQPHNNKVIGNGGVELTDQPCDLKGDPGDPGAPGESVTGPQGEKGDKGDTGDTGADGATGPAGADGVGVAGPAGPTGSAGPSGANGTNGVDGVVVQAAPVDPPAPVAETTIDTPTELPRTGAGTTLALIGLLALLAGASMFMVRRALRTRAIPDEG